MTDLDDKKQNEFMIEKIKERPVNKAKLIRRTLITAVMAVIFGWIACFTFLILEPVISNWLYPEKEAQVVVFPEDQEEMTPEQMLSDNMQIENQAIQAEEEVTNVSLEQEQIQEILSKVVMNKDNYRQLYTALSEYVNEMNRSMVTVTGVTSNIDWFNNVEESSNQVSGVIIANNGKELLILLDYTPLRKAESLTLTFHNGVKVGAQLKEQDMDTNLAIVSVNLSDLERGFVENQVAVASLGSSSVKNIIGTPVVALGSPLGNNGSIGYGIIASVSSQSSIADTNYKLLQTDIIGSQNAEGMIFNIQGQLIGIITENKTNSDLKNLITAYGITELKKCIEKMSNGQKMAYLGISGMDVTKEANEELLVPFGAYVKEVEMDSPSMLAGIQQGDILIGMGDREILSYGDYTTILMQMEVGDIVEIRVMRQVQDKYKEMKFEVELGEAN